MAVTKATFGSLGESLGGGGNGRKVKRRKDSLPT